MRPANPKVLYKLFLSALLLIIIVVNTTSVLDRKASIPVAESFERALITFAVVRGINAIISVVQGTEIAIEPAGVGVILTPGEVFDPVNDLIERFSWIMLAATTSLGAQKVLIGMGLTDTVQYIASFAALVLLLAAWQPKLLVPRWQELVVRLALLILFLRLTVPVMVIANSYIYNAFLDEQYQSSYTMLEQAGEDVRVLQEAESDVLIGEDENESIFAQLSRWYDRTTDKIDVNARIDEYQARLENASEHIIDLIVVFMLQTVVFPLLLLWLFMRIFRNIAKLI